MSRMGDEPQSGLVAHDADEPQSDLVATKETTRTNPGGTRPKRLGVPPG
jgi:hypothetical protein